MLASLPALALVAVLGSSQSATGATSRTVVLEDISFKPGSLVVRKGALVTFAWRDGSTPHNVTARGKKFPGTGTRTKGVHRVRFRKAGSYPYVCTIHPGMSGRIVVR